MGVPITGGPRVYPTMMMPQRPYAPAYGAGVPVGYGGAPMGGAPLGYVPYGRAQHPYAAPFPSAPYTSMYSMSPQAYYSFAETGSKLSAYKGVRKAQLEERRTAAKATADKQ